MDSSRVPQYIGLVWSFGSTLGRLVSRPVFSIQSSSWLLYGLRPTAAAASELPIPFLRTVSQSSRLRSLVLTSFKAGCERMGLSARSAVDTVDMVFLSFEC